MTFRVWCLYSYLAHVSTYPVLCKTQHFQRDHGFVRREKIIGIRMTRKNMLFFTYTCTWPVLLDESILG